MSPSLRFRVYDLGEDQQATTEILGGFPMSSIQQDDVLLILKLLDESAFDELHVETEDFKLWARKHGKGISLEEAAFEGKSPKPPLTIETTSAGGQGLDLSARELTGSKVEAQLGKRTCEPSATGQRLNPIKAPMLGTFYRTPKPGAPPYVEVGSMVNEDDPVGIIEVMKLFNTVKAGVRGQIVQVCAEQGQMVEFQQTLFLVEEISEEKDLPKASPA
jgi:acetyl-CoA carboxylase biotin carboxyl carrier protein